MKKIFVSSTFRDMQSERDAIKSSVLPRVKDFIRKRGYDISFTDLRWGISSESMDSTVVMCKILSVCAKEIDACRPYLIVLLGERYGTVPDEQVLKIFLDKHKNISFEEAQGKSITELEIIYALKKQLPEDKVHLIVCIRNQTVLATIPQKYRNDYEGQSEDKLRLIKLKQFFEQNYPHSILKYDATWDNKAKQLSGLNSFVDKLTNSIIENLKSEMPNEVLSEEQEQYNHDAVTLAEQANRFAGRSDYLGDFDEFLEGSGKMLLVRGVSGIGKTSLMAKVAQTIQSKKLHNVISLFLGNGQYNASIKNILKNIIFRANILLGKGFVSFIGETIDELKHTAKNDLLELSKSKMLVLHIDNLDAVPIEEVGKLFDYLPIPYSDENYKIIISATQSVKLPENALIEVRYNTLEVFGVNESDITEIISKALLENGKELGNEIIERFREVALFRSPLFISLIVKRLLLLSQKDFIKINKVASDQKIDGGKALEQYLLATIADIPQDESSLSNKIMVIASNLSGFSATDRFLDLVVVSKENLRVDDILAILTSNGEKSICALDVISLINTTSGLLFVDGDGRVKFCHGLTRIGFTKLSQAEISKTNKLIFAHLNTLSDNDIVKQKIYLTTAYKANEVESAAIFISKLYSKTAHAPNSVEYLTEQLVYNAFHNLFSSEGEDRDEIIKFLNNVSNFASTQSAEFFNAICQQFLFGIYFSINKTTLGIGDSEINLLQPLYEKAKVVLLSNFAEDKDYLRTYYMVAEKCGVSSNKIDDKWNFYLDFNKQCIEYHTLLNELTPHLDYAYSDLAHSYEKLASIQMLYHRWREAAHLYDLAIETTKAQVKLSTERIDILDDLRFVYMQKKYSAILSEALLQKELGWSESDEFIKRLENAENELSQCVSFFEEAVNNFVDSSRSMDITHYWYELMCSQLTLSDFHHLRNNKDKQRKCLEKSLFTAESHYKIDGNAYNFDRIRNINFRLANCDGVSVEERLVFLKKSFDITDKLLTTALLNSEALIKFQNEVAGQLMKIRFELVHTKIDIESDAFIKSPKEMFFANATEITVENFDSILNQCKEFLTETKPPIMPQVFSYHSEREKSISTMFDGMMSTSGGLIRFGAQYFYREFDRGCKYLNNDNLKAAEIFSAIIAQGIQLLELANLFVARMQFAEDFAQILFNIDFLMKATHNLYVIAYENHDKLQQNTVGEIEVNFSQDMLFFSFLHDLLYGKNELVDKILEDFRDNNFSNNLLHHFSKSAALLQLFSFCIKQGGEILDKYMLSTKGNERKYYYHFYQAFVLENDMAIKRNFDVVGEYLCKNIENVQVRRIIFHSNFFECIALEYAYKNCHFDIADKIIANGYDNYLEIGTLYIIRKYDRKRYFLEFYKLKMICLKRNIQAISDRFSYRNKSLLEIYGKVFCDEFVRLAQKAKAEIDPANNLDPRNHEVRNIPDWAK